MGFSHEDQQACFNYWEWDVYIFHTRHLILPLLLYSGIPDLSLINLDLGIPPQPSSEDLPKARSSPPLLLVPGIAKLIWYRSINHSIGVLHICRRMPILQVA